MKRVCLFAGYDSQNIVRDYAVYYIKELSTISDVYYMADNEISENEKSKILPYVKGAYGFKHKKYDFGSWQELIKIIGWDKLSEYDELILANDSVFGPIYPIHNLFSKLDSDKEWDICGINFGIIEDEHINYSYFLHSYFIVLKNKAFTNKLFKDFICNIKEESSALDVVLNYELKFTEMFYKDGFTVKSLVYGEYNTAVDFKKLIKNGSPFLRKKVFSKEWNKYYPYNLLFLKKYLKKYDHKLILQVFNERYKYSIKEFMQYIWHNLKIFRKNIIRINIRNQKVCILGINILNKDKKLLKCPIYKIGSKKVNME